MPVVLPVTIAEAALEAGFSARDAATMVAIALAESGGKTDARNKRSDALGLWQILPSAHPWIRDQQWQDPKVNARAAKRVVDEAPNPGKITHNKWTTYPLASSAFLPIGAAAVAAAKTPGVKQLADATGGALEVGGNAVASGNPLEAVGALVSKLGEQALWVRVAKVVAGASLVVVGVLVVARPAVEAVAGAAGKAAKVAAVA